MEGKWFEKLVIKSMVFALLLFALFFVLKLFFVLYLGLYHNGIGAGSSFKEGIETFFNALRYESRNVAMFSIIYFVLGLLLFWSRVRWSVLRLYVALVVAIIGFVCLAEVIFYEIFEDVFNSNLLGLLFDDRVAILQTGVNSDYSIMPKVLLWLILSAVFIFFYIKFDKNLESSYAKSLFVSLYRARRRSLPISGIILFLIFALFMTFSINSAFSLKGVSLDVDIKPVNNAFLRKATPGAFRNLYLVYLGYQKIANSSFSDYSANSPRAVAEAYFNLDSSALESRDYDLKTLLAKRVRNSANNANSAESSIDYVFFIVAESLSEWHFDSEFDDIELTAGMKSLLDSGGVKIGVFLQNAGSTIKSIDVLLTGLFQTEIPPNTMLGVLKPFITAPGVIAKDLGYTTNFYYGGSGIWQKLDKYTQSQGFDNMFYNTHIIDNAKFNDYSAPYEGIWGAYDHYLLSFVRDNTFKNRANKSFNMILTTSNHPPYDVPLEQFSVPLDSIEAFLQSNKHRIKDTSARFLGHIWHTDKQIAKFISDVTRVLPNSLFVITGDHYDREYPFTQGSIIEHSTIPLIIYSPMLDIKKLSNVGSHIDITPSIIELIAPHNYTYHSFGKPLVSNDVIVSIRQNVAYGYFSVATDRFFYNKDGEIAYFNENTKRIDDKEIAKKLYERQEQGVALSWWILKHGYIIPKDEATK